MKDVRLSDLSAVGTDYMAIDDALQFAQRARAVRDVGASKELRKFHRLMRLVLRGPPPLWMPELEHVRSLTLASKELKEVPSFVFDLPRLSLLFLDGTPVEKIDGLERSKSLSYVSLNNTPLGGNEEALADLFKAHLGFTKSSVTASFRRPLPAHRSRRRRRRCSKSFKRRPSLIRHCSTRPTSAVVSSKTFG